MDARDRRFSRAETALILRRATDGVLRPRGQVEDGLTLDEIVAAAREVGIDPRAVRRAAALSTVRPDPVQTLLVGAPVAPRIRGRFSGRFPTGRGNEARAVIEETLGRHGELEIETDAFLWHEEHGLGRTWVRARQDGDAVEVSAEAEARGHLLTVMMGLATAVALLLLPLGGFAGLGAMMGPLLSILAPVATILLATRILWPILQRPVVARLQAVVLEVGALVEDPGRPAG